MMKIIAAATSGLLGLGLAAALPPQEPGGPGEPPPPPKRGEAAKKKGEPGPPGDLRRAYDLIRKTQGGGGDGPQGEWNERAADLYRRGLKAHEAGDHHLAHEYGAAAHDLARAVDHSRNAALYAPPAGDLPPPPRGAGPEEGEAEIRRDLRHAHDRIVELGEGSPDARYYIDAARDLYNKALKEARGDAATGRARELAKAAEAMTHVPEHLGHAVEGGPEPKEGPHEPKARPHEPKARPHEPKAKADVDDEDGEFPPPL